MNNLIPITIYTGADFTTTFTFTDQNNKPIDITGNIVCAEIRRFDESVSFIVFDVDYVNASLGQIKLTLNGDQTLTLKEGRHYYDILLLESTGNVLKIVNGYAIVKKSVTLPIEDNQIVPQPLVFGLTWQTTVNNPCNPNPWIITNNNLNIKYLVEDSANCGGTCASVQSGTATATITVGPDNVIMGLDFDGIGETEDAGFERINFLLNNNLIAAAESKDLNLGCSSFQPVNKNFIQSPPYLLPAGTTHTLLIDFTTGDPLFHIGCFYEVRLSFGKLI
jgi:hypothetical protein